MASFESHPYQPRSSIRIESEAEQTQAASALKEFVRDHVRVERVEFVRIAFGTAIVLGVCFGHVDMIRRCRGPANKISPLRRVKSRSADSKLTACR